MNVVTGVIVLGFILVIALITVFYVEPKLLGNKTDGQEADAGTKAFEDKKARLFKGTIAVSIVYGVIALGILIGMFFVPRVRDLLGESFYPFSITFVVGAILIITFLILQIVMYAPVPKKDDLASLMLCPDYWELQETPADVVKKFPESDRPFVKYACVPQAQVYGDSRDAAVETTPDGSKVIPILNKFNEGKDNSMQMDCNRIYPAYLAMKDKNDFPKKPNTLRCDLSARCSHMPWSNVCP